MSVAKIDEQKQSNQRMKRTVSNKPVTKLNSNSMITSLSLGNPN